MRNGVRHVALLTWALACLTLGCQQQAGEPAQGEPRPGDPILVLVAFDGWRSDYSRRASTPNLDALAARGVAADALIPVFPPKTFPNHYTIVTGLYPEHHGIVSNTMDDPAIGERFALSAPTARDPRWWSGEPLWATAERQGRRAASMFWPGSDVAIGGAQPTSWFPYDGSLPNANRVGQVLDWLALPEAQRPAFITVYFSDVDSAGHEYGPNSPEVIEAAERLDGLLGELLTGIESLGLTGRTTVAVVSDHGMSQLSPDRVVFLDDFIDLSTAAVIEWSPVLGLAPRSGSVEQLYGALKDQHPSMAVYRREDTPEPLHYRAHHRIPPVLGIASDGWTITSRARFERERDSGVLNGGAHGYLPTEPSMQGLFVAAGPRLQLGARVPAFENVHLYELFCAILWITPAPNDGNADVTRAMLVE
jgi:predicted AlkP superfamily pyrophosphatase or phosphodiesterase